MPQSTISLQAKIWPYLILVMLVTQVIDPRKLWTIFLVGITVVFGLAYFWARSLRTGLNLNREMRFGWSQVGDRLQERFSLTNTGWAPGVWVVVYDHSDLAGYEGSLVTRIDGHGTRSWFRRGVCSQRGLYTIGPTTIETGDPFGIFKVYIDYPTTTNMVVVPPVVKLPEIEVAPGGRVGEGVRVIRALDQTVTASGVREYRSEDSLRFIHWPTTVRKGEMFVRTFDSNPSSDTWILLDLYRKVQAGKHQHATEEHAIVLTASLANRFLDQGNAVGLAAYGKELIWLPPRLEESQVWQIMRTLAVAKPGDMPLKGFLARAREAIKHRSSLVIITPDLTSDWLDSLYWMMMRGVVPTVLLLDTPAFGGRGDLTSIVRGFLDLGVNHYVIGPDLLDEVQNQIPSIVLEEMGSSRGTKQGPWRALP